MERLKAELRNYYYAHSSKLPQAHAAANRIGALMDDFQAKNPGISPYLLKATLHETIADEFEPVLFPHSPFYFEMGVKPAESWGVPFDRFNAGGWMFEKNSHLFRESNALNDRIRDARTRLGVSDFYGIFPDSDHHCFGCGAVLEGGLEGLYQRALAQKQECANQDELDFVDAAARGLLAVKKIAAKFGAAAKRLLPAAADEQSAQFLAMIAATAARVPWSKPTTFYEGLATLWFLREVCSSIEGIGVSVIGHVDRHLDGFYRSDISAAKLTRDEALDLVERFLLPTDHKKDFYTADHQETSTTLVLGGCDKEGREVCNDVTFLFLKAHDRQKLVNPKLNCRYSAASSPAYLDEINRQILAGRNVMALFNDDCLINAQVRAGKKLEDARQYVAGGCHEPILEGLEHSAGAAYYIHMPRILELSIHDHPELREDCEAAALNIRRLEDASGFEDVYDRTLWNILDACRRAAALIGCNGRAWPRVNPAPFFSAALAGCLEQRKDYTAGGGRYNPSGLPLVGFANVVDSLYALKKLCFDSGKYALADFLNAVRGNWKGCEALRQQVLALPKFGDDQPEVNALAKRFFDELHAGTRGLVNERGGGFQISYFAYYHNYLGRARMAAATPDGRYSGEVFSHGISPRSLHRSLSVTSVINSVTELDLKKCAANAILDLQLPLARLTSASLTAVERAFAARGGATLQMNCVDEQTLRQAQKTPERYRDLIVRVAGMSARFVALSKEMQDEMINRNQCAMQGAASCTENARI
jgi:formate C-acetyltransferase